MSSLDVKRSLILTLATRPSGKYMHISLLKRLLVLMADHLGPVATKHVFGVSEKARLKPVSSATETS